MYKYQWFVDNVEWWDEPHHINFDTAEEALQDALTYIWAKGCPAYDLSQIGISYDFADPELEGMRTILRYPIRNTMGWRSQNWDGEFNSHNDDEYKAIYDEEDDWDDC